LRVKGDEVISGSGGIPSDREEGVELERGRRRRRRRRVGKRKPRCCRSEHHSR